MEKKPKIPRYWSEFISWKFWLHTIIVDLILAGIWLGINKLTSILPIIRDIGYLALLIAGMFCVAWYLPKLTPQYMGSKNKPSISSIPLKKSRLQHDNILWEGGGRSGWGCDILVIGPLCPKDFTLLSIEHSGEITDIRTDDIYISDSPYHSRLYCSECKGKYLLDTKSKNLKKSRDEVRNRFEGKRRREQES